MSEKTTNPSGSSNDSKEVRVEYVNDKKIESNMEKFGKFKVHAIGVSIDQNRDRNELNAKGKAKRDFNSEEMKRIENGMTVKIRSAKDLNKPESKKKTRKVKKSTETEHTEK